MNDYEVFRQLATHPFTSATLEMLQSALRVIRRRYPVSFNGDTGTDSAEFPPREAFEQTKMPFHVTSEWIEYMKTIGNSIHNTAQEVSPSLRRFARGDHSVDHDVVTDYIRLLQSSYPSSHYADPVIFTSNGLETAATLCSTSGAMTVIPCNYEGAWCAAVAYADCVQLYGVQAESSSTMVERLQDLFPGRKVRLPEPLVATRLEDTGVLMLLSMRMLVGGSVPAQCADVAFLQRSRARIFVELLTKKLDAEDRDVSSRIQEAHAEDSLFFDEAFAHGEDLRVRTDAMIPADIGDGVDFTLGASPDPGAFSFTGLGSGVTTSLLPRAPHHSSSSPQPAGPAYEKFTSLRSGRTFGIGTFEMPPTMSGECKTMLAMMSEAVAFYRSSRLSGNSELAVIWSAIRTGQKSEFYRRYGGVLFYREMLRLKSDRELALRLRLGIAPSDIKEMRRLQSNFRIWHDICQLRHDWGPGQYALLCVLPERPNVERMSEREQQVQLRRLQERLDDDRDPLSEQVDTAKNLCTALVQGQVDSDKRLLIDDYHFKAYQDLSELEFAAYMSLDPRPVIPIERHRS
ncbi:hypothetical protein BDP55DRAFT_639469 [Colletotrichum godetiae]|uniref:Uncharacterized protein n=1 Tax=Colletotrichum godetiae TaxID=1209918 RepID=A0AAJ0EMI9_9PEZI|nr:uncharacterized protein BDP55DRAFT_639469 [Colletotrichum godetiae]KAK1656627.1 hypothetical protein BDP55DRAFT_639469 [Colletotrichum godetiae]